MEKSSVDYCVGWMERTLGLMKGKAINSEFFVFFSPLSLLHNEQLTQISTNTLVFVFEQEMPPPLDLSHQPTSFFNPLFIALCFSE